MNLSGLLPLLHQIPTYRQLLQGRKHTAQSAPPPLVLRLPRGPRAFVAAALQRDLKWPVLLITARVEQAQALASELAAWLGAEAAVARFAEPVPLPYERAPWGEATRRQRLTVLAQLVQLGGAGTDDRRQTTDHGQPRSAPPLVVASARALMQKTLPRERFIAETHTLRLGQVIPLERTLADWVGLGYEAVTIVEAPGQFSHRGGILDIYPPPSPFPVRIELFGDEIESLRAFDPATQRSRQALEAVTIPPAREAIARDTPPLAQRLAQAGWREDLEALATGAAFPTLEFYLPYLYEQAGSLLDYFPSEGLVIVDDWAELADVVHELSEQADQLASEHDAAGDLPPDYPSPLFTWEEIARCLEARGPLILGGDGAAWPEADHGLQLRDAFAPGPRFGGQIKPLLDYLGQLRAAKKRTVVVTRQAERLAELWAERDAPLLPMEKITEVPPRGSLIFVQGALSEGFALPTLHLLTDAELFGWSRPEPRRRRPTRAIAPESLFADLRPGDFVVHLEHGIGRFAGLVKRAPSARHPWQHELEARLPLRRDRGPAASPSRQVKHDMEQPRPMDRLICGDVGYGKTEVALRAASRR
jgi:transcription-repair coupling factor (superfamily II helicase)